MTRWAASGAGCRSERVKVEAACLLQDHPHLVRLTSAFEDLQDLVVASREAMECADAARRLSVFRQLLHDLHGLCCGVEHLRGMTPARADFLPSPDTSDRRSANAQGPDIQSLDSGSDEDSCSVCCRGNGGDHLADLKRSVIQSVTIYL